MTTQAPAGTAERTAVDEFVRSREGSDELAASGRWSHLVPLSAPAPGEQYGFEVDLDACSGCKACVSACHHLNGLDPMESWRRTGMLLGQQTAYRQTVTTACHHCVEPACLEGCPVGAYEKDPVSGIVAHLDDQCFGCSYCTMTCPYEVPRFDDNRGIVRKCDMCHDRLAEGEAPACVQACPTEAISVSLVDTAAARAKAVLDGETMVPGAPPSRLTVPTTRYRSAKPLPADVVAADAHDVDPAHDHLPLAIMLVLTQLSVGAFCLGMFADTPGTAGPSDTATALSALALALVAMVASVAHLGRPWLAWRAVIGIRTSWLSREIVAFGAYAATASMAVAARLAEAGDAMVDALDLLAAGAGLLGVGCSVAVYTVTGRRWWSFARTTARFGGTMLCCGSATLAALAAVAGADMTAAAALACAGGLLLAMAPGALAMSGLGRPDIRRSGGLLRGPLQQVVAWRVIAAMVGMIALVVASVSEPGGTAAVMWAIVAAVAVTGSELIGRRLFFLALASPRFPGELR